MPPAPDFEAEAARRVLAFWFGTADSGEFGRPRPVWFQRDDAFDAGIREGFLDVQAHAAEGRFDGLAETPEGSLALILMLDQFPRNLFRGEARAFESDRKARLVADAALQRGFDAALLPVQRLFMYLPFEHSENIADQERSVALFLTLGDPEWILYAERHREIIARFGRFPHRNAALGRASTEEELAFLKEPNSAF